MKLPTTIDEDFDVAALFLEVLTQEMEACRQGEHKVHLPRPEEPTALPDWDHIHMVPELFFQLGGRTHFSFPGQNQIVKAGEAIVIPRHLAHKEKMHDGKKEFCHLVALANQGRFSFHVTIRDPD